MENPFLPGNHYAPRQLYGFAISFGGTVNETNGCRTSDLMLAPTIEETHIHQGLSWNYDQNPPEVNFHIPPGYSGA